MYIIFIINISCCSIYNNSRFRTFIFRVYLYFIQRCRLYKAIYPAMTAFTDQNRVHIGQLSINIYINLNLIWILTVCCMSYVVVNLSLFVVICTARQGFLFCNKVIILYWIIMPYKVIILYWIIMPYHNSRYISTFSFPNV